MKKIVRKRTIIGFAIAFLVTSYVGYAGFSFYVQRAVIKQAASLSDVADMPAPKENQKILVFSPHPDDETLGCGGYIATATENKAKVSITLITDGNRRKLKALRFNEFQKATKSLGVGSDSLIYLNYPDGSLAHQDQAKLSDNFAKVIDQKKPDIIISPYSKDAHPDHATSGRILEGLARERNIPIYEYLVHFRRFPNNAGYSPNYYLLPPTKLASDSNWLTFGLSKEIENKKYSAEKIYRTQISTPTLRSLFLSLVRRNELFWQGNK